ncbi:hypothetical protein [Pseudactinotalea sp.]|uniref:hypothetical protein n=1 Tax=Pseudactinotalea sp. TaxID=1926260 RepID=UPI003B3A8793
MTRASGEETVRASSSRRRLLMVTVAALVLLVAAAFLVNSIRGDGSKEAGSGADGPTPDSPSQAPSEDDPTESPDPLDVDGPSSGPIGDLADEEARVVESLGLVVEATNEIGERGDGAVVGLDAIATGFVLGELENLSREYLEQGYTQSGEAHVVSTEILSSDLDAGTPHIVLGVCIDVSEISLTDANGNDASDLLYNPGHPVRHEYGADFIDDVWKLSTHEIPAVQDCSSVEES